MNEMTDSQERRRKEEMFLKYIYDHKARLSVSLENFSLYLLLSGDEVTQLILIPSIKRKVYGSLCDR